MNRWITTSALLAASLLPFVGRGADAATEPPKPVLSSETEPRGVVAFLRKIINGRTKADAKAKNFLLKGQVSMVTVEWKAGMKMRTAETMPVPQWRSFSLVQRGAKRRLEAEYIQETGKGDTLKKTHMTAYRLSDGESFYTLDGNAVEILGNKEDRRNWESLSGVYYTYGEVHDGKAYGPLVDTSQKLIDRITKGLDHDFWKKRVLRCSNAEGLLLVDNDDKVIGKSRYRYRFWVDPSRGYRVVKSINQKGGPGRGADHLEERRIELQEPIPGVFIDQKGTEFVSELGTVAMRDGRAGWLKREMKVTEVAVEDFEYDDKLFDWHTLPIPVGAHVTDHRSDPPLTFNHKKKPLDEEVLRAGLRAHPPPRKRHGWLSRRHGWYLAGALTSLCAAVITLLLRNKLRRGKGKGRPEATP